MAEKGKKGNLFAALGAASGLSNAFRFPALLAGYGCSFLLAVFLSLVFVCYPVLCAELGTVKRRPLPGLLRRAAAVNSLIISLYYVSICSRLACFGAGYAAGSSVSFAAVLPAVLAAIFLILKRGLHQKTGALSVAAYFVLFGLLALCGGLEVNPYFGDILNGGMWVDALSQAILSLSLAAGVMPGYAQSLPKNFSPPAVAAKIIAVNFLGCIVAALGTLPYIGGGQSGGVGFAFEVFPQVVSSVFTSLSLQRLAGVLVFACLTAVALHSTCSLALPALSLIKSKCAPAVFCIASGALYFAFTACGGSVLAAVDRACCSVAAVGVMLCECVFFVLCGKGALNRIYMGVIAAICALFSVLSACGARFDIFPLPAVIAAASAISAVALSALPQKPILRLLTKTKAAAIIKLVADATNNSR